MRNAALTLGLIGGIMGMFVGFFAYGYVEVTERFEEVRQFAGVAEDPQLWRLVAILSPLLAIAGGAMSRARALWGGILLILSAAGMYHAFGFNVATMFPIAFCGVGGLMGIAAGRPDEEKAHF
ncbi:hypothetical protein HKCCE2091_14960 [Rhodobacterales bacterium HKCCE2091]|nr:hypothetical protein [Rhodobacterales bacterium HKCCE2091]